MRQSPHCRWGTLPLAAAALLLAGCVEIGPGGPEAKGPSAGPVKAGSVEAGPGGVETKGLSAGPLEVGDKDTDHDAEDPDQETKADE